MTFLLIPLDEAIVFPGVTATLPIDTGEEERVFLLPRQDGEFGRDRRRRRGDRARPAAERQPGRRPSSACIAGWRAPRSPADGDELRVEVQEIHDGNPEDERSHELMREYRAVVEEILELRGADERIAAFLRSIEEPGALADTAGYSPDLSREQKLQLLETLDVKARLELAVEMQRERLAELQVRRKIRDDVESGAQKQQREYFLRKQMESIRKELGEDEGDLIAEYETQDRRGRDAGGGRRAGRARAAAPRAPGRAVARVLDDPQLPRLAARGAVVEALRGAARPRAHPRGARRGPRRPR